MRMVVVPAGEGRRLDSGGGPPGNELVQFVAGSEADVRLLGTLAAVFAGADPAVRLTQLVEVFQRYEREAA